MRPCSDETAGRSQGGSDRGRIRPQCWASDQGRKVLSSGPEGSQLLTHLPSTPVVLIMSLVLTSCTAHTVKQHHPPTRNPIYTIPSATAAWITHPTSQAQTETQVQWGLLYQRQDLYPDLVTATGLVEGKTSLSTHGQSHAWTLK